jgi:hypothetical protein
MNSKRMTTSCEACRTRKKKCNGSNPCSYCIGANVECRWGLRNKRGPKKGYIADLEARAQMLRSVTSLLCLFLTKVPRNQWPFLADGTYDEEAAIRRVEMEYGISRDQLVDWYTSEMSLQTKPTPIPITYETATDVVPVSSGNNFPTSEVVVNPPPVEKNYFF